MKGETGSKKVYQSFGGHGMDVSINRADDLDKITLTHMGTKESPSVLDLGCGAGGQSLRLALGGTSVTALDKFDFRELIAAEMKLQKISEEKLKFIHGDISSLENLLQGEQYSDVSMQRTLHYLPYTDALKLLKYLHSVVTDKMFVSVTGLSSQVAFDYPALSLSIENRFSVLHPVQAEIFGIHEPVCLYSETEFVSLLEESGWKVEKVWVSAFGNIKAVCHH